MTIINNYYQSKIGITEKIVTLNPIKELDSVLDVKNFIHNYRFSRFGFNLIIMKRLIKKLLLEKLQTEMIWNKKIWANSKVILLNCEFIIQNNKALNQLKNILDEGALYRYKGKLISNNRLIDIEKLINKINKNITLDPPLFISGKILNQLGGKINANEIFVIDGSRRILANTVYKDTILIWLIV